MDELVTFDGPSAHRRTTQIPAGEGVIVTDTLLASGTFVLSHHLARALRDGRPAVLLSFVQPRSHYAQILQKAGVSLASERAFAFIDGLRLLAEHDDPLDQAYAAVDEKLASFGERSPLILLDDVTAPLWAGGDVNRVFDFYRAIRTLCLDAGASSLAIFRADATFVGGPIDERPHDPADDWLLRACIQRSSVWLQLRAIVHTPGTGEVRRDRCGSADAARIVVHRAPGLGDRHHGLTSSTRARPSQYRLGESGATLFAKGLASGFL